MLTSVKSPRNGCGLHGALQTVTEIKGIVPIVHANAGCAIQNYLADKSSGQVGSAVSGEEIFSTDALERHVIFGGASRLREQIKNTIKVAEADLYIVLNSCESAMVGDDVEAMTRESREQGEQVIECLTAGFHGDSHYGYEAVVSDILKKIKLVKEVEKEKNDRLVNIFGVLPHKDIYFKGDLEEIKRILEGIGIKVNTFFGADGSVEDFSKASGAALNIVFSKWGREPARFLSEEYSIPTTEWNSIPTGPEEVSEFLYEISGKLGIDEETARRSAQKEKDEFAYYLKGIRDSFYEEFAGRSVAVVGDESTVVKVAGYLKNYLDADIRIAVVTDYFGKAELSAEEKAETVAGLAGEVYFTQDSKEIQDILIHSSVDLVLGSSLDRQAVEEKGTVGLDISYPGYGKAIMNRTYSGMHGALTLTEDYLTAIREADSLKEKRLLEYIRQDSAKEGE